MAKHRAEDRQPQKSAKAVEKLIAQRQASARTASLKASGKEGVAARLLKWISS